MKFFNQNFKNINSISNEMEFFLSCISPQAKKLFDIKQLNNEFKTVLKDLKLEKLATFCKVADVKNDCILIAVNHPAILQTLNFKKAEIKFHLQEKLKIKIKEIFVKNFTLKD